MMIQTKGRIAPVAAAIAISLSGTPAHASAKPLSASLRGGSQVSLQSQLPHGKSPLTVLSRETKKAVNAEANANPAPKSASENSGSGPISSIFDQMSHTAKTLLKVAAGIGAAVGFGATALYWKRKVAKAHIRDKILTVMRSKRMNGGQIDWSEVYTKSANAATKGADSKAFVPKAELSRSSINSIAANEQARRERLYDEAVGRNKQQDTGSEER
ncbi:MAG: hypothetical protein KGH74_02215 [Candidatus Micrarchaeota archaeon]|nr:hypothetical protein [Candidatus Micrarchaeota archaeon]